LSLTTVVRIDDDDIARWVGVVAAACAEESEDKGERKQRLVVMVSPSVPAGRT
jgi:hypothetical protein